jgi:N6-adenosine-specific RNA methylase IME4
MQISNKKYYTILADPPWMESGGGKIKRGADAHYPLMKTRDIIALPVKEIAEPNCHLYLWTTNNFLPDALKVIQAWGFEYKTCITWFKDRFGLGQYFRGITEHCLFGVKGVLPYKVNDGKRQQGITAIQAPRREHSRKPDELYSMIEKVSYGPYMELFARQRREGWDAWGNEIDMRDDTVEIR